jgi:hypothetical protein
MNQPGSGFEKQGIWRERSFFRLPDNVWQAVVSRVRSEFEEMPSLRVTRNQACMLFGLSRHASDWVLSKLADDGFLQSLDSGEYVRRSTQP